MQFLIHFVVGVTHQRGKAFITTGSFNAAQHVDGVGIGNIGDDQTNQAGTTMFQSSCHQAGTVVEIGNGLFNAGQ